MGAITFSQSRDRKGAPFPPRPQFLHPSSDEKRREMRRYRKELGDALAKWEETGELDGHVCGLIEETELAHSNPMPQRLSKRK